MTDEPNNREEHPEEEEDVADLPEREAMSLLPSSLIGGLGGGATASPLGGSLLGGSSTPPADPSQVPAAPADPSTVAPPNISVPHIPVPAQNPGATYSPDTTATNQT